MNNSVLSVPLGRLNTAKKESQNGPRSIALIMTGICLLMIACATAWVWLIDDPLGGEPRTVVSLEKAAKSFADLDLGDLRADEGDDVAAARATDDGGWSYEQSASVIVGGPRIAPEGAGPGSLSFQPDPRLIEDSLMGALPRVGEDGSRPMDVYSAPLKVSAVNAPKIALIVGGIGLSQTRSHQAVETLPSGVTFAFSPYGASLDRWTTAARQKGHELLLQVPLEPFDYPDNDPGPHTLLVGSSEQENLNRLHWVMSRITNYVGLINVGGARFTAMEEPVGTFIDDLSRRGLMLVDDGASARTTLRDESAKSGLPQLTADAVIDSEPTADAIRAKLLQLEHLARSRGHAIGVAAALPVTIEEVAEWAEHLNDRGVHLVPVTAVEAVLSGRIDG